MNENSSSSTLILAAQLLFSGPQGVSRNVSASRVSASRGKGFRLFILAGLIGFVFSALQAVGQTSGTNALVDVLGTIPAQEAAQGLGFNISQTGYTQDWQFATAKAAGASWVRIQCPWSAVEQQTPAPSNMHANPQFIQTPQCAAALASAAERGLHVTIVAGYGPPNHELLTVTVPGGASNGSTSLAVAYAQGAGTLASMRFPYDYICPENVNSSGIPNGQCTTSISGVHSYQGTLITSVSLTDGTHAVVSLASALTQALPNVPASIDGCSITIGSELLTCTGSHFKALQAGSTQIVLPGAGSQGSTLTTSIGSVISATQVMLEKSAGASVSNIAVEQTMLYGVHELLYPSTTSTLPSDPSVKAYGDYVTFLAFDMAARGVSGDIELWNEPPWPNDPWDNRCNLYDLDLNPCPSAGSATNGQMYLNEANFGFIVDVQNRTFPSGVTATWSGTNFSSNPSILSNSVLLATGERASQPATVVSKESAHPYGGPFGNPEDSMGTMDCLHSAAVANISPVGRPGCYLAGERNSTQGGSNMFGGITADLAAKMIQPTYGVSTDITETNLGPTGVGQQLGQARFNVRQFLGFEAIGITPIEFFELWDGVNHTPDASTFSFVNYDGTNITPLAGYTALAGLMEDISPIANAPNAGSTVANLPSISSYSGTYPLTAVNLVGSRKGAAADSDLFTIWQRSVCLSSNCWNTLPSPAAAPVVITIPIGMQVTSVVDLVTRAAVSFNTSGQQVTVPVADNPVGLLLDPSGSTSSRLLTTSLSLRSNPATSTYGTQVVLTAALTPYTSAGHTTDGETVVFSNGATTLGSGTLAGGVATLDTTSLPVGIEHLNVSFGGNVVFQASSSSALHTVSAADTALSFVVISDQVYGIAPFQVSAASASAGLVTYNVISGPAAISGSKLTVTGVGTVVLQAKQAAAGNYAASSVQTSFTVSAETPNVVFGQVAPRVYGAPPLVVGVSSPSKGVITYSVVSGPATVSGNKVTLTGAGTIVIGATQAALGNYAAGFGQLSIPVAQAAVNLYPTAVPQQVFGVAPFAIGATSVSSGVVAYTVLSGPARVVGHTVQVTGVGVVKIGATQSAAGNYLGASAQISFAVVAAKPTLTLNLIANQIFGSPSFSVSAQSDSSAAITYGVIGGPAKMINGVITTTNIGMVTVRATQAAGGNYTSSVAQTTFNVTAAIPTLSFTPVADHVYSNATFWVTAASHSVGTITYSVVSGPATLSARVLTMMGVGTVVLKATQVAAGNYVGSSAQTSFNVSPATPVISFKIPNQAHGNVSLAVGANSPSAGAIAYRVVSGPATVEGSTVRLTGAGTVTVQANQAAAGNYSAAAAQASFTVNSAE